MNNTLIGRDILISKVESRFRYLVKIGKIKRPKVCSICQCKKRIVAHHEDYKNPYRVFWVCDSCHGKWHWAKKRLMGIPPFTTA